jgi:hypothetical protein
MVNKDDELLADIEGGKGETRDVEIRFCNHVANPIGVIWNFNHPGLITSILKFKHSLLRRVDK